MKPGSLKLLVLAGGFGTRLQPLLQSVPKALAPVGGVPFIELQLEHWIAQQVRSFVFLLHHQAGQIMDYLDMAAANGLLKNCEVISLVEPSPMDTGGAVASAVRELDLTGDFLVTNADTWIGLGIEALTAVDGPAIAVTWLDDTRRYGQVQFDDDHRVIKFAEKNAMNESGWINAGLCRLCSKMFENWDGSRFSLEKQTFPELVKRGELRVVPIENNFIDIGIPDDYRRFCRWVEGGRKDLL
jgi:NDP-sugar pyrophosphorylase family protein